MQSYVNKIVGAAGWRSLCGNPILFWQLPGEHSRSFSSLRLWICVQLVSKNRTSHDWWCCSITTGSVNSQLFVTSLQKPWRGDIVSVLLRLVSAAPKWANQVQGSHQAWIRQTCLACKACWSWHLFFCWLRNFCFLVFWSALFLLTELWNVFGGSGSRYSGTISETGVRRAECYAPSWPHSPNKLPPIHPPIHPLPKWRPFIQSLSAPLAVSTHFQCHDEGCQISCIQLIRRHIFPLLHH